MAEHAEEALAARLVETYSDRLLRLAYSILNSVPDAQDVCQEVLLKRLEYPGAFENEKHEQAWMVRVTVNACKNVRRSPWRTRTVGLDAVADRVALPPRRWRFRSRRRAACWKRCSVCLPSTGRCWCSTTI